jgi:large conductance mechanosensitive channel
MPIIGAVIGGLDFTGLGITVGESVIAYGNFIQAVINFLLIALVLFFIVKAVNKAMPKKEAAPAPPPGPTNEEKLLAEIRDLLKKQAR